MRVTLAEDRNDLSLLQALRSDTAAAATAILAGPAIAMSIGLAASVTTPSSIPTHDQIAQQCDTIQYTTGHYYQAVPHEGELSFPRGPSGEAAKTAFDSAAAGLPNDQKGLATAAKCGPLAIEVTTNDKGDASAARTGSNRASLTFDPSAAPGAAGSLGVSLQNAAALFHTPTE